MKIKDITIGQALYYVGNYPGMRSMHGLSGIVRSIDESNNQLALEMSLNGTNPSFPVHLTADDVSPTKPASREELRAEVQTLTSEKIDLQNKILVLEGQAQERSRQLDLTKDVADKYNADIARMGDRLKQAERQVLRHEESLKTIRASNEVLRGTNETLIAEKKTLDDKLADTKDQLDATVKARDRYQELYNTEGSRRMDNQRAHDDYVKTLKTDLNLLTAELVEVKTQRDNLQKLGDNLCDSGEKEVETLNSTIVSLRSQIQSLQSIQESMKMMQEGHAPAMKKLQGELHKALHQRDQHKQNSAYWRGVADKLGYNDPAPTKDDRLDKIEMFLRDQFESFR